MSRLRRGLRAVTNAGAAVLDNPILVRELQGSLRQRRFVLILTLALLVLGLALSAALWGFSGGELDMVRVARNTFLVLSGLMLLLVLLVFPSFAATAIVEERAQRSLDLLLTSRLSGAEIALGKLLGALVAGAAFLSSTAPLAALTSLFGGASPGELGLAYAVLLGTAVCVTCYALLVSASTSTAAQAVTRTYLILPALAALTAGPLLLAALPALLGRARPQDVLPGWVLPVLPKQTVGLEVLVGAAWALGWSSLFWVQTASQLAPPGANRARLPRLWCVGATLGGLLLCGAVGLRPHAGPGQVSMELTRLLVIVLCAGTVMLLALAVDDPSYRPAGRPARGLRGLLEPGAERGALLALLLHLLVVLGVGAAAVRWYALPATSVYRAPGELMAWGALLSGGWLFSLAAACMQLARRGVAPVTARFLVMTAVLALILWPGGWWLLGGTRARPEWWRGYALSPLIACASLFERPRDREAERHLVLFGPSWAEISDELTRTLAAEPQPDGDLPTRRRVQRERREQRERALLAQGLPAYRVVTIAWWAIAGALWLSLGLTRRRAPDGPRPGEARSPE